MFDIKVDDQKARELYLAKLEEKIKDFEVDYIFWDTKELRRRTCMSWNTIQKEFFYEKDFPKTKLGGKWYFPAKETKEFLLNWIKQKGQQQL